MTSVARMNLHSPSGEPWFLGIDVGGTDVKLGLVGGDGVLHHKQRTATAPLGSPQRVFEYALASARAEMDQWGMPPETLAGVGVAVPGVLDSHASVLREVVNLPGWTGVPLLGELSRLSQRPSVVLNDANAAAYAEHTVRGLGDRSLALVTLGTGVGCGLVLSGQPHGGDHGCAGELGHVAIEFGPEAMRCTCGSRGHLESYAGAAGVIGRLRRLANSADAGARSGAPAEDLTPRDIAERAEGGDRLCQRVITETAEYVGRAIGFLGQTLDPDVVLLGGAMTFGGDHSETGRHFLDTVRETITRTTLVQVGSNMTIEFATLGNDAGVLGAARMAQAAALAKLSQSC